ncbi:MAG: MFS transporter [Acidobacteria bacterium]|nr:MFS transporter [Acidobacteriota bacterium]
MPTAPSKPLPGNYKWYVVAMLWWIAFFNYADRQAIFSVFPLLQSEMQLSNTQLGALGSSFAIVYGLGAVFAGSIVDRIRRKSALLGGLHAWSVICMATALSRNFTHLVIFRALEGLGETFYFPASMSLISDYHDKKTRSRAMGFHQTSVYVGTIGGGFFAGLIGQHYGWRLSFLVFGGAGVLLGFLLARYLREPQRGEVENVIAGKPWTVGEFLSFAWRTRTARVLLAAFACSNFVATVMLSWMPKFLYDKFHLSLAMAGLTATLFLQLASLAGSATGGWWADMRRRHSPGGRMQVQALGLFCGAPFVVLCGMTQTIPVLVAALIGWGFFKGLYDANIFASMYEVVPPEARGGAAGLMNTIGWLAGGGTAPIVIGFLADQHGLGFAISITAVVYVIAAILLTIGFALYAPKDIKAAEAHIPSPL